LPSPARFPTAVSVRPLSTKLGFLFGGLRCTFCAYALVAKRKKAATAVAAASLAFDLRNSSLVQRRRDRVPGAVEHEPRAVQPQTPVLGLQFPLAVQGCAIST
jgi:hypothetical protein